MTAVHVVVPDGIDDPSRPSGGNAYDRQVCRGLAGSGWSVHEHQVRGSWPQPDVAAVAGLTTVIASIPDGAVVLLDGLIASTMPGVLVPEASRLRLVVLVHMPLGGGPGPATGAEHAVLSAAVAVVTTSGWTRQRLLDDYALAPGRVHVAVPGSDTADLASGSATGGELLTVAAVTPGKGHDLLLAALATVTDLAWRWSCVGTLDRDPAFVEHLRCRVRESGLADRVRFTGARTGADLAAAYAGADLLVLASRAETYGMVVTEALARGLPVVATAVGGLPEALGSTGEGSLPGVLVPAGDPDALATALRGWLEDTGLRGRLRRAARERREVLPDWATTVGDVSRVLTEATA